MPWNTLSIEEAKLENWDKTEEKTLRKARTSSLLLWKKLILIQLRTFSSHKIEIRMNVQTTIPIWTVYRSDLFVPYVQFSQAFCKTKPRN